MLGHWWRDVTFAGPGMSCPSLSSTEGQRQLPLLFLGELHLAYLGMGGGGVWSQIWREGWLFTGMRLWMHASFYICPPDELRKWVLSPGSFLIRTTSACSHQGIMVVPLLSCDSLVMVT